MKPDKKFKILVVDDEPDLVFMVKNILQLNGFEVSTAGNGTEGLKLALKERPDLILLDIIMPEKDGFRMLFELKKDELTRSIPVILLSAKGETSFLFEGERLRANDYIIKPVQAEKLLKYIKRYLTLSGK